jgi:hypothetical protein
MFGGDLPAGSRVLGKVAYFQCATTGGNISEIQAVSENSQQVMTSKRCCRFL